MRSGGGGGSSRSWWLRRLSWLLVLAVGLGGCASSDSSDPLIEGREVYGRFCSVCHGAAGQGATGPPLRNVVDTWPACPDHIEWVALGSAGWSAAHGPTYGASGKPVTGGMPAHEGILDAMEIAVVSAFERVRFGGADSGTALADCGLDDPGQ